MPTRPCHPRMITTREQDYFGGCRRSAPVSRAASACTRRGCRRRGRRAARAATGRGRAVAPSNGICSVRGPRSAEQDPFAVGGRAGDEPLEQRLDVAEEARLTLADADERASARPPSRRRSLARLPAELTSREISFVMSKTDSVGSAAATRMRDSTLVISPPPPSANGNERPRVRPSPPRAHRIRPPRDGRARPGRAPPASRRRPSARRSRARRAARRRSRSRRRSASPRRHERAPPRPSRWAFELVGEPITRISVAPIETISFTASCRFCVA